MASKLRRTLQQLYNNQTFIVFCKLIIQNLSFKIYHFLLPLFYQHNINETTKSAIWKIEEPEDFFLSKVPLQRDITHPHKRLQHLAGRYLLQYLFSDFPYEEMLIADTRKPYLPYEQYHFSISHCGNYAAAIVSSSQRVGIDIEIPRATVLKIAHKFLHKTEIEIFKINNHPTPDLQLLTLLWCAKEAMFKWWGWGEVDFSEMLRINYFDLHEEGNIQAKFLKSDMNESLELFYKQFKEICLVFVAQ